MARGWKAVKKRIWRLKNYLLDFKILAQGSSATFYEKQSKFSFLNTPFFSLLLFIHFPFFFLCDDISWILITLWLIYFLFELWTLTAISYLWWSLLREILKIDVFLFAQEGCNVYVFFFFFFFLDKENMAICHFKSWLHYFQKA